MSFSKLLDEVPNFLGFAAVQNLAARTLIARAKFQFPPRVNFVLTQRLAAVMADERRNVAPISPDSRHG
jgi:hypothetical protein